jgi:hypothetical protein
MENEVLKFKDYISGRMPNHVKDLTESDFAAILNWASHTRVFRTSHDTPDFVQAELDDVIRGYVLAKRMYSK